MAHAPGWIELYGMLEAGQTPPPALVAQCRGNRNGIGENMLHWYAIEGSPEVLQRLVELGFPVDATDDPEDVPILSAARIGRWDNVRVLRRAGARTRGVTPCGFTYRGEVTAAGDAVPPDLRGDAYTLDDLLDFDGPEDQPVVSVALSHPRLTPELLAQWLAERPDLALSPGDVEAHCFWLGELGQLHVASPSAAWRQLLHHGAKALGVEVAWSFDVPEAPSS